MSLGHGLVLTCLFLTACFQISNGAGAPFAPYYDTFLDGRTNNLTDIFAKTGQASFHLAFALGANCIPMWGAKFPLDDPDILSQIRDVQAHGGEMVVATGGALGNTWFFHSVNEGSSNILTSKL